MIQSTTRTFQLCFAAGRLRAVLLLRLLALVAAFSMTLAQVRADVTWIGGVGNYLDGNNWSGGSVPIGGQSILIANGGTAQIAGTQSVPVSNVTLGSGNSGTLEIGSGINTELDANEFYAGYQGLGTFTVGSQAFVG